VVAPGGANGICTFCFSSLAPLVVKVPIGMVVIGDNAYSGCEINALIQNILQAKFRGSTLILHHIVLTHKWTSKPFYVEFL
jgi:hypothetical protein